ncbi:hypothetical protein SPBR_06110 [Sporothrix brasiliensis 5110]|uniref:FAR1 domain-containing protein n=1 Tax=Sporothrix brasiliensis 5110 TaxID=1398154 RepID=A0A0C2JCF2_9PEZI|nr:uncharacterized protein SPBR_06110 [Sporothrix brasiliensis 5110]KIH94607.1 hypothetical protein SPBR_06110 [Sporothrix brasiliensis 5110]
MSSGAAKSAVAAAVPMAAMPATPNHHATVNASAGTATGPMAGANAHADAGANADDSFVGHTPSATAPPMAATQVYPDGFPGFGPEVLPPEAVYHSREDAYKAINALAAAHGYAFITSRSFQTSGGLTTAMYSCDRSGRGRDPNRVMKRQRAASRRTDCHFSVYVKERRDGLWQVRHRTGAQFSVHNHAPSEDVFAHRVHRSLDADQKDSIDVLLQMDMKMKQIVTFLRLKYRKNVGARDVSNYIASARRAKLLAQPQHPEQTARAAKEQASLEQQTLEQEKEDLLLEEELREQLGKELQQTAGGSGAQDFFG